MKSIDGWAHSSGVWAAGGSGGNVGGNCWSWMVALGLAAACVEYCGIFSILTFGGYELPSFTSLNGFVGLSGDRSLGSSGGDMPWRLCKARGFLGILERILAACVSSVDGSLGVVSPDVAIGAGDV